jgi:hypothetical protein
MFFNPHPPSALGRDILLFEAKTNGLFSSEPAHKNQKEIWLIFSKTPFGTQARDIQYT